MNLVMSRNKNISICWDLLSFLQVSGLLKFTSQSFDSPFVRYASYKCGVANIPTTPGVVIEIYNFRFLYIKSYFNCRKNIYFVLALYFLLLELKDWFQKLGS